MRKFIYLLLSATMLVGSNGWAISSPINKDAQAQKGKKCLFPNSRKRAPSWICNAQDSVLSLAAVGSFDKSGAGIEFMEQMAAADARAHLVMKLNDTVQKKITDVEETANKNSAEPDQVLISQALISKITNECLEGSKVLKKAYGPRGKLYVLIGFDEAGTQKLHESIAAAYLEQKHKLK